MFIGEIKLHSFIIKQCQWIVLLALIQRSIVSEQFLNGPSAQLGYTLPFKWDARLYAIAYRRWSRVILQLSKSIRGSGRNITTDNFFTSYKLAKDLMQKRLTIVGTMCVNRTEIPREMLPDRRRPVYFSEFRLFRMCRNEARRLLCCRRNIETRRWPVTIKRSRRSSNAAKSSIDVLDKLIRMYSCKRPSRRWGELSEWVVS